MTGCIVTLLIILGFGCPALWILAIVVVLIDYANRGKR